MNKNLLYLMASAMMGMADAAEHRHVPDEPQPPKRTCKDCYFYMGGTYCKRVKHNVNKLTPANGCVYFKGKIIMAQKKVTLEVGDLFKQAWKGCLQPMWFKVLSINRPNNSLRVECHSFGGDYHEEEWDDLDVTENAFSIGEYKMMEV